LLRRVSSLVWAEHPLMLALLKHPPVSVLSSSSLHPLLPSMAMVSDPLVKNIKLSSQSLLCDAATGCKLVSVNYASYTC
jgi:hypothetical protein